MSIMDVLRKDLGSKGPKAPKESKKDSGGRGGDSSPRTPVAQRSSIAMSSSPRANLLPPEVIQRKRDIAIRRRTWWGVVVVVVLVLAGVAGSFVYAQAQADSESTAEAQQAVLRNRLTALDPVKNTESDIAGLDAARKVGGSTDIDWQAFVNTLESNLPAGTSLSNISITGTSATASYLAGPTVGGVPQVATVSFTATTPTIPVLSTWVDDLSNLPGFISTNFSSVTQAASTSGKSATSYTSTITVALGDKAFSHYYLPAPKEAKK